YDALPGQTFVTGFLRSYANLLNLDAVAIVELYKSETGAGLHAPSLAFPEPTTGGRMPGAGILLGTFVIALILLAGWFLYQESESFDFERVAELPEHLADKITEEESPRDSQPAPVQGSEMTPSNNVVGITPAVPLSGAESGQAEDSVAAAPEAAPLPSGEGETAENNVADNVPASESEEETRAIAGAPDTPDGTASGAMPSNNVADTAASGDGTSPVAGAAASYPQDTLNTAT